MACRLLKCTWQRQPDETPTLRTPLSTLVAFKLSKIVDERIGHSCLLRWQVSSEGSVPRVLSLSDAIWDDGLLMAFAVASLACFTRLGPAFCGLFSGFDGQYNGTCRVCASHGKSARKSLASQVWRTGEHMLVPSSAYTLLVYRS
jgi:hypothetical protein